MVKEMSSFMFLVLLFQTSGFVVIVFCKLYPEMKIPLSLSPPPVEAAIKHGVSGPARAAVFSEGGGSQAGAGGHDPAPGQVQPAVGEREGAGGERKGAG